MKSLIVLCAIISLVAAAAIPDEAQAVIVNYESSNDGSGNYKFSYETSNGITREETGRLVNVGAEDEHIVVEGSYSYTDVDGLPVFVRYTADENGYHRNPLAIQVVFSLPSHAVATLLGK